MKISIVIPSYNNSKLNNQILKDLSGYSEFDEIILMDDASPNPEVVRELQAWSERTPKLKVVCNEGNLHFLKSSNKGLRLATGEIVVLISTDVRVGLDVGSLTRHLLTDKPNSLIGGKLLLHDTGWNTFDGVTFPYLEGWLLATTKENWEKLDYFDERYVPSDMEDVDLSTKAVSLGMGLIPLNSPYINHVGAQTIGYNDERRAITVRNKELFRMKWMPQ